MVSTPPTLRPGSGGGSSPDEQRPWEPGYSASGFAGAYAPAATSLCVTRIVRGHPGTVARRTQ